MSPERAGALATALSLSRVQRARLRSAFLATTRFTQASAGPSPSSATCASAAPSTSRASAASGRLPGTTTRSARSSA